MSNNQTSTSENAQELKKCSHKSCKKLKPLTSFQKTFKNGKTKTFAQCDSCRSKGVSYIQNNEKSIEYAKKYKIAQKENGDDEEKPKPKEKGSNKHEHKVIDGVTSKMCSMCKEMVSIENYYKNKNTWDGLNLYCKDCFKDKESKQNKNKLTKCQICNRDKTFRHYKSDKNICHTCLYIQKYENMEKDEDKLVKCSGRCGKHKIYTDFINQEHEICLTCDSCRKINNKSRLNHLEDRQEDCRIYRANNKEKVALYNYSNNHQVDWEKVKEENNIENQVIGKASPNRKEHIFKNNVLGKDCSKCKEWRPLKEYNINPKHWDNLRTQCIHCLHTYRTVERDVAQKRLYQQKYEYEQRKTNPQFKLRSKIRKGTRDAFVNYVKTKKNVHIKLLGCMSEDFYHHIKSMFEEGMKDENYGEHWQMDHILPLSKFDLTNAEEFLEACHWSNIQPLTVYDNLSKGNKIL